MVKTDIPMQTEASLQEMIVKLLEFKGYFVYMNYQNIMGKLAGKDDSFSKYAYGHSLIKQGWKKGIPDLHVLGNNKDLYIECKSKKGKLSPDQENMILTLRSFGKEVRVVNDISQIEDLIDITSQ